MKLKTKILFLWLGSLFPCFAAVMYFVLRPQEATPTWFSYFCLTYLAGQHILVSVVSRRMARGTQPQPRVQSTTPQRERPH
jgi:hypothetical protein